MVYTIHHSTPQPHRKDDLVSLSKHASAILSAQTDGRHYWKGVGSLSFKYAVRGEARYKLKDRYLLAESHNFIMLNQEQPYEIFVESRLTTETFCVFFGQPLVADVLHNASATDIHLLDYPEATGSPVFFERTQPLTAEVRHRMASLHTAVRQNQNPELAKESLHEFLACLIALEHQGVHASKGLEFAKQSTRVELLRRITIARDYLHAMRGEAVTLEKLAEVSCLSPNHLLRSFRQAFGTTPIRYLNQVRLQKAKQLLHHTGIPIQEVCHEVGYASLGTFSNHFKLVTGSSPTEFRRRGILDK